MVPASDDEAVCTAFVQWVSAQAAAPRHATRLIEHIEVSHDHAGLLDTEVHGRRLAWRSVPAASRTRVTTPATVAAEIDVWTIEPLRLRERTIHIAACDGCAGEKKIRCAACNATGKIICGACNGQRKAYGYASNGAYRLLNCTACRGKGEIDCRSCRRGIAVCPECAREGRLQRWMEIESWQRTAFNVHPGSVAADFAWLQTPANDDLVRDAELLAEFDQPHQLTRGDIDGISEDWLSLLRPEVTTDERIARQRLRVARIPERQVQYRVGDVTSRITFSGLRLVPQVSASNDAFARRAARLHALRILLTAFATVIIVVSLARGAFFRSLPTLVSLIACCAGLAFVSAAAADWTAARLRTRIWVIVSVACLGIAIAFAIVALPQPEHARQLIAAGRLDAAESELQALGSRAPADAWAGVRLERVRRSTDITAARNALAQIPSALPQHATASVAVDALILRTARDQAHTQQWSVASNTLALLSEHSRGTRDAVAVAESVCAASAREDIARRNWSGAATAIAAARQTGVTSAALEPLQDAIHSAAAGAAETAQRSESDRERLRQRLKAEAAFAAWETSVGSWGTPSLIAVRTAMARDVAAVERSTKRRKRRKGAV
jgi:hypothetical protein